MCKLSIEEANLTQKVISDLYSSYKLRAKKVDNVELIDVDFRLDIVVGLRDLESSNNIGDLYDVIYDGVIDKFIAEGYVLIDIENGEEDVSYMDCNDVYSLDTEVNGIAKDFIIGNTKNEFVFMKVLNK